MRRDRVKQLLMIAFGTAGILAAQTKIDLSSQARRIDFSNSTAVKPLPVGTVLPATCSVGEMFFKLDAPDGENLYMCPAKDIWSRAASPLNMQAGPAGGVLVSSTGESFDVDADTMFVASQAGNNQYTGHNDFGAAASLRVATGPVQPAVAACDSASETGSIYVLTGDNAKANLLYICQAVPGGYAWRPGTYAQDTAPPASCAVGEMFFDTDAPAGENLLGCTSPNMWTMLGKQSQKGTTAPGTCTVGDVFFDTDAPAGENWLGCTAANTWTVMGKPSVSASRLLTWQKQAPATTLSVGETVIASTIVPGGTIPNGACLRFRAGFQHTTGTASVEYRIRYGTSYLTALAPTTSAQIARLEGFMCNDPASTGAQQIAAGYMLSTSNSSEQMTTMTVDSTLDQMFSLAAVGPATDAVTLRYFLVEVLK